MTTSPEEKTGPIEPLLSSKWSAILISLVIAGIFILGDQLGIGGETQWTIIILVSIFCAAALQWRKHVRPWFWPALAITTAVQFFLVWHFHWTALNSPMSQQLKGAIAGVGAADALLLWWLGWLFDPHEKPRTSASVTVEITLYGFAIILVAIIAVLIWGVEKSAAQKLARAKVVLVRKSNLPMTDLIDCYAPNSSSRKLWTDLDKPFPAKRLHEAVRDNWIEVDDVGPVRNVIISTLDGKPLRTDSTAEIDHCLNQIEQ